MGAREWALVIALDIPKNRKWLLSVLAGWAVRGEVEASVPELARATELSEATVHRELRRLIASKKLVVKQRTMGRSSSTMYHVNLVTVTDITVAIPAKPCPKWMAILREAYHYDLTEEQEEHLVARLKEKGFTDSDVEGPAAALVSKWGSYKRKGYVRIDMTLFNWVSRDVPRGKATNVVDWESELRRLS